MPSIRPAGEDETPMLEDESMRSVRLSRQLQNDKRRAQINRNAEIKRAKGMMNRTQNPPLKKQLKQRIDKLEAENKQENRFL